MWLRRLELINRKVIVIMEDNTFSWSVRILVAFLKWITPIALVDSRDQNQSFCLEAAVHDGRLLFSSIRHTASYFGVNLTLRLFIVPDFVPTMIFFEHYYYYVLFFSSPVNNVFRKGSISFQYISVTIRKWKFDPSNFLFQII